MVLAVVAVVAVVAEEEGHCIWYDTCGWDQDYGPDGGNRVHFLNCHYTGPGKPASAEQTEIIREICPHLFTEGEPLTLCCSLRQLVDLQTNFLTPQGLIEAECPTCYYNFKKNFCDMTCSSDQSQFVRADHVVTGPGFDNGYNNYTGQEVEMVKDVTYFVTDEFNTGVFESCENVQFPAVSDTIMFMLCGAWGSTYCTPHRWFDFLGSVDNGYAPFQINYEYGETDGVTEDGFLFHNPSVIPCGEVAPGYSLPCPCSQCPVACNQTGPPDFPPLPAPAHFTIAGRDGLTIVMAIIFAVGTTVFIALSLACSCSSRRENEKKNMMLPNNSQGCTIKSNKINEAIERFFTWWGLVVARNPVTVLLLSLVVALAFCFGVFKLEITTDPIELWASPSSRSRIEKDFFDSEFRPFYRTALVIAKVVENEEEGVEKFNYTVQETDRTYEFGAMFNKKFLKELLVLQKKIENITFDFTERDGNVSTGNDLTRVCNSPLSPLNKNCNINSVWAYWRDEADLMDVVVDKPIGDSQLSFNYLDHFLDCSRNPSITPQGDPQGTETGCLAKWGGPVNPYYVLGGFIPEHSAFPEFPEYHKSQAVVMQIIINNFDPNSEATADKEGLRLAMAWEEKFVEFMQNWSQHEMPVFMDVAFTSERSVQDELNRETYGDLATIAVSYVIMFIYITLSLGQYGKFSLTGFMVESKVTLGLFGVMIVLLSVFASIGIFALVGVPATLIIFEIIPFLVLAVGVDNIFILVQTYQRDKRLPSETHREQVSRPSMTNLIRASTKAEQYKSGFDQLCEGGPGGGAGGTLHAVELRHRVHLLLPGRAVRHARGPLLRSIRRPRSPYRRCSL